MRRGAADGPATIDRSRVEALVRAALGEVKSSRSLDSGGGLLLAPDRGVNLGEPFDARAMRSLLASTPARIAVGRAGTRYRTNTLLRFRADHAAARDAVLSEVDEKLVARLGLVALHSRAASKTEFLQRPDAGRSLADESRAEVEKRLPRGADLLLLYGDGLSASAITAHLEPFHAALVRELASRGIVIPAGAACFIRHSRVKIMDEVCRLAEARACVFVCGERPGLGFSDSLSAYYIYRPPSGVPTDADREVISNINPRGLDVPKAAIAVAEACARILRERKSGVVIG